MKTILRENIERKMVLTEEEWKFIADKAVFVKIKKNEFIQTQNSHNTYECFILKGSFKIYTLNEKGTESILHFSFTNEWMCDLESFYHKKPACYNIKALEESELLIINKLNKALLFTQVPKLLRFHIAMVEKANIATQKRLLDVLNKTSKERYREFILKNPQKIKKINNKNMSSYLGVSEEFLSKIKKEYKTS